MLGHSTFCLLVLILNLGKPRCEHPHIINEHVGHVGIGHIPDHLRLVRGGCLLSLLREQVLDQLLCLTSLEGAGLQLHLVLIRLDGGVRGAHGHEGKDDVVRLRDACQFVDLVEVDVLRDQVDVLLLHQLVDFLLLLVLIAASLFFFPFLIITAAELLVLRCLRLLLLDLCHSCGLFLLRLFMMLANSGLLFFFLLLVLCRLERLPLGTGHGVIEIHGLLRPKQLQAHLPLVLVLIRVLLLHLQDLVLLSTGQRLRAATLAAVVVIGVTSLAAFFAWLLTLLRLLLAATLLIFATRGTNELLVLVILRSLLGLLSLLPLLLVLELQLHQALHCLLVLADLDHRVGLVVPVRCP